MHHTQPYTNAHHHHLPNAHHHHLTHAPLTTLTPCTTPPPYPITHPPQAYPMHLTQCNTRHHLTQCKHTTTRPNAHTSPPYPKNFGHTHHTLLPNDTKRPQLTMHTQSQPSNHLTQCDAHTRHHLTQCTHTTTLPNAHTHYHHTTQWCLHLTQYSNHSPKRVPASPNEVVVYLIPHSDY